MIKGIYWKRFGKLEVAFWHQWGREEREDTHNDIDLLYLDLSTNEYTLELNGGVMGIGFYITFDKQEVNNE